MFYVVNKSKIYSYVIALGTVLVLFVAAAKLNDVVSPKQNLVETSANIIEQNSIYQNEIQNRNEAKPNVIVNNQKTQ